MNLSGYKLVNFGKPISSEFLNNILKETHQNKTRSTGVHMSNVSGTANSNYGNFGKSKTALLKKNRFTAMAFIIALGAIGLIFSGVSDSPSGMVVGNISEISVP